MRNAFLLPTLVALAVVAFGGCDNDPISEPTPLDVEGRYDLVELRFTPSAPAIAAADVAASLEPGSAYVELLGSGQALFRFRTAGGPTQFAPGRFGVNARQLRVEFDAGTEPELRRVLLLGQDAGRRLTFDREDGALVFVGPRTVNLEAYDPVAYGGLTSVPGTLRVRVTPRASG